LPIERLSHMIRKAPRSFLSHRSSLKLKFTIMGTSADYTSLHFRAMPTLHSMCAKCRFKIERAARPRTPSTAYAML
jgi:hypothetical protein